MQYCFYVKFTMKKKERKGEMSVLLRTPSGEGRRVRISKKKKGWRNLKKKENSLHLQRKRKSKNTEKKEKARPTAGAGRRKEGQAPTLLP